MMTMIILILEAAIRNWMNATWHLSCVGCIPEYDRFGILAGKMRGTGQELLIIEVVVIAISIITLVRSRIIVSVGLNVPLLLLRNSMLMVYCSSIEINALTILLYYCCFFYYFLGD